MTECKGASTPASTTMLTKTMSPTNSTEVANMSAIPYRQAVGALNYLAVCTRPDIAYAVSSVSRFLNNPGPAHWTAVKHIFRYLKRTQDHGLKFSKPTSGDIILGPNYSDSDWAGDLETRRSTTGYIFHLSGAPITWRSRRQPTVVLSSTEAEYMALSEASQEALWLRSLLHDIGFTQDSTIILGDNKGSLKLATNPVFHKRTKHIDIRHHFIRESVENGTIQIKWVPTEKMVADLLTKPLSPQKFNQQLVQLI